VKIRISKNRGSSVKGVVYPVKIGEKFRFTTLSKLFPPLFFTERKLRPSGIRIEAIAFNAEKNVLVV